MSNTYKASDKPQAEAVETLNFEPIKGYPMLNWRGKRPFTSTHFYPAQLKEQHGSEVDGWLNRIYWGDNLQVMSHLLKNYRGKVQLAFIDPPFDSKADYKKKIQLRGREIANDRSNFEEKQYTDIFSNDEYLQFMFERLVLVRELLDDKGSIFVQCDRHRSHLIRCLLDEVFGNAVEEKSAGLQNEIVWFYPDSPGRPANRFVPKHDLLYWYSKGGEFTFNAADVREPILAASKKRYESSRYLVNSQGKRFEYTGGSASDDGKIPETVWRMSVVKGNSRQNTDYPTQKPEQLLDRIILAASNPNDLVFDCFMGSGTTQAAAMKLGRRFLGADINLGSIQTTTKRLIGISEIIQANLAASASSTSAPPVLIMDEELPEANEDDDEVSMASVVHKPTTFYTGFEVYNVNNYEIFRNPIEAKDILIEALELQKLQAGHLFDGERDGRMWKIMPVNKIATRQDLNEIISGLNLKSLADRLQAASNQPAEKITLVCMGHEPDLAATLNQEVALSLGVKAGAKMPLDVQVLDILRDRGDLQFKRDSEAKVAVKSGKLVIEAFYPMNLLSKLSLEKEKVGDWREMVDSVMVDFNYDGAVFNPTLVDIPEKNALVAGSYPVPDDAGTVRVKMTDVLSESLELEVQA